MQQKLEYDERIFARQSVGWILAYVFQQRLTLDDVEAERENLRWRRN